jgi:signal transduction histidine kinase
MVGLSLLFHVLKFWKSRVYQIFFKKSKLSLSVMLVALSLTNLCAQNSAKVDSLQRLLSSKIGTDRCSILYSLAYELFDVDNIAALAYAEESFKFAYQLGDSLQIVKSGRITGQIQRRVDDLNGSIDLLTSILPIAKRNHFIEEEKKILNALAVTHTFRAEYDQALKYHFESLKIRESEGRKDEISIAFNNIGVVYYKLRNHRKALEYYLKCIELKKSINYTDDLDRNFINTGLCYNNLGDYSKARSYIRQGMEFCKNNCSDAILVEGEFGLGHSFFNEYRTLDEHNSNVNDLDESLRNAEKHFSQSYSIAKTSANKRFQIENLIYLAQINTIRHKEEKSKVYLQEAESIAQANEYNQLLIEIYQEFSNVFTQTKNFEQASFYQNKYIRLKDSVYSEQLIENLAKVQTEFAERKNIATIAAKEQVIKQQRDLNFAIAIIALLAGLLILVLQRSNRTIKRVNAQLSEAKEVIQEQNNLLEDKNKYLDKEVEAKTIDLERANQSLKQVNDELDNFIYKTSHDIRGPLASLKGMCNVALMDVTDPVALDYLRKLDNTAERLNTILTRLLIINQINNSKLTLSKIDFEGIVKDVLMLEKKKGLPQKLIIRQRIDEHKTIQSDKELIRIVLENLIDNAIKFYNDSDRVESFVEIHIVPSTDGHIRIRVIDNGIGISESNPGKLFRMFFRASERSETGGIGLYIVKTATSKLGGKVGLLTTPEGFTEFYVDFPPLPPHPEDGPDKPSIY